MARCIDADELISRYNQIISDYSENGIYPEKFGIADAIDMTEQMPPIKMDWFSVIAESVRDYSEGGIWSDGYCEILCRTESAAGAIADMLQQLYRSQGEDVVINTGYYDPEEDRRQGEEDRYTGWWYINVG